MTLKDMEAEWHMRQESIGSDDGLSFDWRQAIIWTSSDLLYAPQWS